MTRPYTINPGDDLDATKVEAVNAYFEGKFPVQDVDQGSMSSSKLIWNSAVPASALPTSLLSQNGVGGVNNYLNSDAMFVRAYGWPHVRRHVTTWMPDGISLPGWPAPYRDGILYTARGPEAVYEIPRNIIGGVDDIYYQARTHSFDSGDDPIHAVAASATTAYVACAGTRKIKTIQLGANGGAASAFVSLDTGTYSAIRKIAINRGGTYLYVVAKRGGDANYKRLLRIDVAAGTVSECAMADDYDIVDIVVVDNVGSGGNGTGEVFVAQKQQAANGGAVFRVIESDTGAYGGAFAATPTSTVKSYAAGTLIHQMVAYHGRVAVIAHTAGANTTTFSIQDYENRTASGAVEMATATLASVPVPIDGGAATDGAMLMSLRDDGRVVAWPHFGAGTPTVLTVGYGVAAASQTPGGLCFNGRGWFGVVNVTASNLGVIFYY